MRLSWEEPTGVLVRGHDGMEAQVSFTDFVQAIENGTIYPEDQIRSRIVTQDQWVAAGEMRLYRILTERGAVTPHEPSQSFSNPPIVSEPGVWPPSPNGPEW